MLGQMTSQRSDIVYVISELIIKNKSLPNKSHWAGWRLKTIWLQYLFNISVSGSSCTKLLKIQIKQNLNSLKYINCKPKEWLNKLRTQDLF